MDKRDSWRTHSTRQPQLSTASGDGSKLQRYLANSLVATVVFFDCYVCWKLLQLLLTFLDCSFSMCELHNRAISFMFLKFHKLQIAVYTTLPDSPFLFGWVGSLVPRLIATYIPPPSPYTHTPTLLSLSLSLSSSVQWEFLNCKWGLPGYICGPGRQRDVQCVS